MSFVQICHGCEHLLKTVINSEGKFISRKPSQSPHVATDPEALGIPSGGGFHVCIASLCGPAGLNECLLVMELVSLQGAQWSSRTTVLYVLM